MSEIDLIPESYRRERWVKRRVKQFGVVYGALLICIVGAKSFVHLSINEQTLEVERLRNDKQSVLEQRARLDELHGEKAKLEERLAVLEGLRGGPPSKQVFLGIDGALNGKVWFVDWTFKRAGEFVEPKAATVNTGYFIIVPEDETNTSARAWQMRTHMEIKAQALDHSALADFVRRLSQQKIIENVKVLDTRSQRKNAISVVDFELAVVVRGEKHTS